MWAVQNVITARFGYETMPREPILAPTTSFEWFFKTVHHALMGVAIVFAISRQFRKPIDFPPHIFGFGVQGVLLKEIPNLSVCIMEKYIFS